jgi:4-alpha-glucanotransferase
MRTLLLKRLLFSNTSEPIDFYKPAKYPLFRTKGKVGAAAFSDIPYKLSCMQAANIFPDLSRRGSGVLLHVTSLPGRYGIGDLGPAAHQWIDMLAGAGQRWWQMLPLGPISESTSPYQCLSSFAGNPLLISPDQLVEDGLLEKSDVRGFSLPPAKVDYPRVSRNKWAMLKIAFERFQDRQRAHRYTCHFRQFVTRESAWLEDFSLFMALREAYPFAPWSQWPRGVLCRDPSALRDARAQLAEAIGLQAFAQFIFFRQLESLRTHARKAGVALIGDLPIFVSPESADVWTNPKLFQLDRRLQPRAVAGVPPDEFSPTGQLWGNPLYNWKEMAKNGFAWWKARLGAALRQADFVRIDHFRGLDSYWSIPTPCATAEVGRWVAAPGAKLLGALTAGNKSLPLLAEDLGLITPEIEQLRDDFKLPGMRILQFGFPPGLGNPHVPHNYIPHCFAYTGTHDNDTSAGWYHRLPAAAKRRIAEYAPDPLWKTAPAWAMIRVLWASTAGQTIVPLQDLLNLGSGDRMNTPGVHVNNWQWRCRDFAQCREPMAKLSRLTDLYERRACAIG